MDAYLATISKREIRDYQDRPLDPMDLERILQAGRATGSASNRQPWLFVVVTDRARLNALAETVRAPKNIRGCAAAIAIAMQESGRPFDAGRAAQNMMIAAWGLGVGSCPNGIADAERAMRVLELSPDRHIATILSLGYPARPWSPEEQDEAEILNRIDRKPLDEIVRRL